MAAEIRATARSEEPADDCPQSFSVTPGPCYAALWVTGEIDATNDRQFRDQLMAAVPEEYGGWYLTSLVSLSWEGQA